MKRLAGFFCGLPRSTPGRSRELGLDGLSHKDAWSMLKRAVSSIYRNFFLFSAFLPESNYGSLTSLKCTSGKGALEFKQLGSCLGDSRNFEGSSGAMRPPSKPTRGVQSLGLC